MHKRQPVKKIKLEKSYNTKLPTAQKELHKSRAPDFSAFYL